MFPADMAAIAAQQDLLAFDEGRAQVTYRVPFPTIRTKAGA
jgi:hypothetical protein